MTLKKNNFALPKNDLQAHPSDSTALGDTYISKDSDWITESHLEYTDIQILIEGEEQINIFPSYLLDVKTPYDADIDCIFYNLPTLKPITSIYLRPGIMGIFHPQDAHTTQIRPQGAAKNIRKIVFKVHQRFFCHGPPNNRYKSTSKPIS